MDTHAAPAIVGSIAVASLVVVPVAIALVHRRAKKNAPGTEDRPASIAMVVVVAVNVALLIFGFAGPEIFPGTWWGHFMGHLVGKVTYVIALLVLWSFVIPVLEPCGITPEKRPGSASPNNRSERPRDR